MEQAQQIALTQHPVLRRLEAVLRQKELIVQREQKAWFPSIRIGIPLGLEVPLLNRNKGGIAAAKGKVGTVTHFLPDSVRQVRELRRRK